MFFLPISGAAIPLKISRTSSSDHNLDEAKLP